MPVTVLEAKHVTSAGGFTFLADASDLGWKPGHVPHHLNTTLGNKQPFNLINATDEVFIYDQQNGCVRLRVYND